MILEYAQLLSTAHRVLNGTPTYIDKFSISGRKKLVYLLPGETVTLGEQKDRMTLSEPFYVQTHINHPSAIWARYSADNYYWLYIMFCSLLDEYTHRYGKRHSCEKLVVPLSQFRHLNFENRGFTEPTPAMPDEYKVENDSIASYRNYYKYGKKHLASWKNRTEPDWFKN